MYVVGIKHMINVVSVFWRTSYQEPVSKILERDDMG
jgi:hypothetical protein